MTVVSVKAGSWIFFALCVALLVGCVEEDEGDWVEEVEDEAGVSQFEEETQEQPIICGSEDWDDMTRFDDSSTYRVGAHYGKAVARMGGGYCTAVLYDTQRLLTAHHCGGASGFRSFTFGEFPGALDYARGRLQDLGASASQAYNASVSDMKTFQCSRNRSWYESGGGGRDLTAWTCVPNEIAGVGDVAPGDIWGYAEVAPGRRSEGTDVYAVSYHKASHLNSYRLLLSPNGEVQDADDSCVAGEPYDHCFEFDADTKGGSSGGPIFDRNTHRLFGLVHGHYDADPGANSCPWYATNYGSYLPTASSLPRSTDPPQPLPSGGSRFSDYIGGHGGNASLLFCPNNYLAAGVIGTSYPFGSTSQGSIGNFGLVCVPNRSHAFNGQAWREAESWVVVVGGSYDTELGAGSFPFNAYIHDKLNLYNNNGNLTDFLYQQQRLTMCAPGQYLTGVSASQKAHFLGGIVDIRCHTPGRTSTRTRRPRLPIGQVERYSERTLCPPVAGDASTAAHGLYVRSGWLTDGFMLVCRRF